MLSAKFFLNMEKACCACGDCGNQWKRRGRVWELLTPGLCTVSLFVPIPEEEGGKPQEILKGVEE